MKKKIIALFGIGAAFAAIGMCRKLGPVRVYCNGKYYWVHPYKFIDPIATFDDLIDPIMDFAKENDINEDDIVLGEKELAVSEEKVYLSLETETGLIEVTYDKQYKFLDITIEPET